MSFQMVSQQLAAEIGQRLETLTKSFAAGTQGLQNAGRTGISALTIDNVDSVLRSITMEDKHFLLMKDIPTVKAVQTVYQYNVKTAVQSNMDLAGWEGFLPVEDTSQYLRVAEILKVYGIRKSITQLAQLVNEAGGYQVDIEKENDTNAAMAMSQSMERDLYHGGDFYLDSNGAIDGTVSANPNGPVRQIRGIQANVREGDQGLRGIPGDFIGFGNNRSVVFNAAGGVLERGLVDQIATAIRDSLGSVGEAHCTTTQLAEFRKTFFPFERGDLGAAYAIRGAGVTNEVKQGFPLLTVAGNIDFVPSVFKYSQTRPVVRVSSVGNAPSTPAFTQQPTAGGVNLSSGFGAGETYLYAVQAVNFSGMSSPAVSASVTTAVAGERISIIMSAQAGVESFWLFRTPVEVSGLAGKQMFCGKVIASRTGTTLIVDSNGIIPGLDSVLFMPEGKERAQLAVLGSLINKLDLGLRGLGAERVYASYLACIVHQPRTFAVVTNIFGKREGI